MSNQNSISAPSVCPVSSAVEETSADEAANHVTFQDALDNHDMPGDSSQGEMNSNTETHNPLALGSLSSVKSLEPLWVKGHNEAS